MSMNVPTARMRLVVLDLPERRAAALALAEKTFGHLDLDGSTVEMELAHVDWDASVGIMQDDDTCAAILLVRREEMMSHARTVCVDPPPWNTKPLEGLRSVRGECLVVTPPVRRRASDMVRHLLTILGPVDYLWGTAHPDLENMGFWGRHSTVLGLAGAKSPEWFFAVPLTPAARIALSSSADARAAASSEVLRSTGCR